MSSESKYRAQQRIDQIKAFESELALLNSESLLLLDEAQAEKVRHYHQQVVERLIQAWDVDVNLSAKRLSWGMQIASLIGALAFSASVFFLFYQYWGLIPLAYQVLILIASPLLTLIATFIVRSREQTGYFSKLIALISFACFVLNLTLLGQIFNIAPTSQTLLVWMLYALILAYACNIRLLLVAAILCFFAFIAARVGTWSGVYWLYMGEYPENFLLPTLLLFWLPSFISQERFHGFTSIYHVFSMLGFFLVLLIMSNWGDGSYLTIHPDLIEGLYQVAGFLFSALAIAYGIRFSLSHVTATGNTFFMLFLYSKFFDWWWETLPKSIFFLLIGLASLLILVIFQRLRNEGKQHTKEALL